MTVEKFNQALQLKGIHLTSEQFSQFNDYFHLLIEWNQRINLTAITKEHEVYLKHFYDSLMPLWLSTISFKDKNIIDIGAGAGFPSIPLLIAEPSLKVTIVDSLRKRIDFLDHLVEVLGVTEQVTLLHGRAEDFGQDKNHRESYDVSLARAVANLNVLAEYCLPFVEKGGHFISLKGAKAQEEVTQATDAIKLLGGKFLSIQEEKLPGQDDERAIILVKKTLNTPNKYPRKAGKPTKQPLK